MFTVNDKDLPITVAVKIVTGTKPNLGSAIDKALVKAFTGDKDAGETVDMFSLEEIKEISDYLNVYYESHKNGD